MIIQGISQRVKVVTNGGIVGAAPGTDVPSNATTLLDGAVTEIISAAANIQDSWGIEIVLYNTGAAATASEACADILIGGATDDVLIAALICGYCATTNNSACAKYLFPLHIPAGLRIAATLASVRTSITAKIVVNLYGGGVPPWRTGRKVTTYGTQINNARGQAIVPSESGAAASATALTATTSEDHFAFYPGFQPATDTTINNRNFSIGIGVGAATEDRIGTWYYHSDTSEEIGVYAHFPAFCPVPAGSRLTLLASNAGTNDAAYDGLIYAVG